MKIKQSLSITFLLVISFIPALASHSQYSNPCKAAPFPKPSKETRQIRVEKYGIAFNIPDNYRTSSYIADGKMDISIYNPSAFEFDECLKNNKVPTESVQPSAALSIDSMRMGKSLIDIARQGRFRSNFRNITFKNRPAIGFEALFLNDLYDAVLFFLPSRKFSVTITNSEDDKDLGEIIKSSFTFINQ